MKSNARKEHPGNPDFPCVKTAFELRIALSRDYYEGISIELCSDRLYILSPEEIGDGKVELQCPHLDFCSAGELCRDHSLERNPGLYCYVFYFAEPGASAKLRDLRTSGE